MSKKKREYPGNPALGRDQESTFTFSARGDVRDFASALYAIREKFGRFPESKSGVVAEVFTHFAILAIQQKWAPKFERLSDAIDYITIDAGLTNLVSKRRRGLLNLEEKISMETNEQLLPGMSGYALLEKARAELRLSDDSSPFEEQAISTAKVNQSRVLRQGREPELADSEAEYEQEIQLITVQAEEEEWGEERLALERDAAMERLKEKRREINDKYPAGAPPTAETTGEKGEAI